MEIDLILPSPGESITTVQVGQWLKPNGSFVQKDEEVLEIESEKASLMVVSPESGILNIRIAEGEEADVGSIAGTIAVQAAPAEDETAAGETAITPTESATAAVPGESSSVGLASVAAAKIIREQELNQASLSGSGKDGRITKGDALAAVADQSKGAAAAPAEPQSTTAAQTAPSATSTNSTANRQIQRDKMPFLRQKISERLVAVKNETAMLTTFNEVDMTAVMQTRKQYKELFQKTHGVGLGFMSFFTKASCIALQEFPMVNAQIDGKEIVRFTYVDVGIAVSAPKGLLVPVIRNAERLSLAEIEVEILRLAGKARENSLSIDEMSGGTFTITNGGVFGSMLSTPILNPPQSAILGMHNIVQRPVAVDAEVCIRPIMYLALSYDHRIIDGREAVGCLVRIKQLLEDPVRMLLQT